MGVYLSREEDGQVVDGLLGRPSAGLTVAGF